MKQRSSETGARIFRTPLGWAGVAASDAGVVTVILPKADRQAVEREFLDLGLVNVRSAVLDRAVRLLERFFAGDQVRFDLPLDFRYYTPFQQAVWKAAVRIPFGETRSYQWIAERIKRPRAARAVGQALGANPIPVLIP